MPTEYHRSSIETSPITVIEPKRGTLDLNDLWHSRELLYVLTLREVKVRYKQSVLGVIWAVIQPLAVMAVFTIFFGRLAGIPSDGIPYSLFALAGLVPWTFFSNAITSSGNSLVGNSSLITKVYFPRMIIPLASIGAGLIDLAISFGLLFILLVIYGTGFSVNLLLLPVLILLTVLLAAAVGIWTAAVNVKYRDVRYALPFLIQLWMFVTPVIYPSSFVPERWQWLLTLNPLTGLIEGYRSSLFGGAFDPTRLVATTLIVLVALASSLHFFNKFERRLADLV